MAWNQPGDDKNRPPRAAADSAGLDEVLRRWQRRLQQWWQPAGGGAFWVILALVAVAWLVSGSYQIAAGERGVIQRFGAYDRTEQPGYGWHWPWPIEGLARVNVGALGSVDSKTLMLTADGNLLNIAWSVQYRIDDPLRYLFQVRQQDATLRQTAEAAVRMAVGRATLAQLLGGDARRSIADDAQATGQKALDSYQSGLKLTTVNLVDVQVPDPVLAAQRDATKAAEDRMRSRQEAQGYANDTLPKAEAAARRQLLEAEAYKAQVTAAAEGDAQRFTALASAYAAAPELTRSRMYIETVEAVLSRAHKIILDTKPGSNSTIYLPLDKLMDALRTPSGAAAAPSPSASDRQGNDAVGATDETRSRDRER
jgi:membrane protease subunit HflK